MAGSCDESDVSDYRDMVTIVRDRVLDMVKKKMTLDQVKAAKPTRDYDGVYAQAGAHGRHVRRSGVPKSDVERARRSMNGEAARAKVGSP